MVLPSHHNYPKPVMSLFIIWFDLQSPIIIKLGLFKILQSKIFPFESVISPSLLRLCFDGLPKCVMASLDLPIIEYVVARLK